MDGFNPSTDTHLDFDGMKRSFRPPRREFEVDDHFDVDLYFKQADERAQQLVDLREVTYSFARRFAKFTALREKVLMMRSRTKFSWSSSQEYRRFVTDSQFAFIEEASSYGNIETLKRLYDQNIVDYEEQSKLENRWAELETELANSEFDMQQKEKLLANLVDRMLQLLSEITLPGHGESTATDELGSRVNSTPASSVEVHPLLAYYFDKAGDANLLREQLANLELEYKEAQTTRDRMIEMEQDLDISEADFEALFQKKRSELVEAFAEAHRVAEDAKRVCSNEGLDPDWKPQRNAESTQNHAASDEATNETELPPSEDALIVGLIETTRRAITLGLEDRAFTTPLPMEARVSAWIEDQADSSQGHETQVKRTVSMSSISSPAHPILGKPARGLGAQKMERNTATIQERGRIKDGPRLTTSSSDSKLSKLRRELQGALDQDGGSKRRKAHEPTVRLD